MENLNDSKTLAVEDRKRSWIRKKLRMCRCSR